MSCTHRPEVARVCAHVDEDCVEAFTGRGVEADYVCRACADSGDRTTLFGVCAECVAALAPVGRVGEPGVIRDPQPLRLVTEVFELGVADLVEVVAVRGSEHSHWLGLSAEGEIYELRDHVATRRAHTSLLPDVEYTLYCSRGARFAAVVEMQGTHGVVIELATGRTLELSRDGYCAEHCRYPFAFVERDGRTLFIHSPLWNQLELVDAVSGECLSTRQMEEGRGVDYFHCSIDVSPNARRFSDSGWVWHPLGEIVTASIDEWLGNPFETELGASRKHIAWRDFWDAPIAWLDDEHVAIYGHGETREPIAGVEIYDARTGGLLRWFAGANAGEFLVDDRQLLIRDSESIEVWDHARGALLAKLAHEGLVAYHPDAKLFASVVSGGKLTVARITGHYGFADPRLRELRDAADLPVLADLLEAAGFADEAVLAHCRAPHPPGRCWVFDRL